MHSDMKARNVLLSKNREVAKISDVGVAKYLNDCATATQSNYVACAQLSLSFHPKPAAHVASHDLVCQVFNLVGVLLVFCLRSMSVCTSSLGARLPATTSSVMRVTCAVQCRRDLCICSARDSAQPAVWQRGAVLSHVPAATRPPFQRRKCFLVPPGPVRSVRKLCCWCGRACE